MNTRKGRQVTNLLVILLAALSLFVFFKFVNEIKKSAYVGSEFGYQNTISVSGEGEMVAIPDVATFSFTVQAEDKDANIAQRTVTEKMNTILDALKDEEIEGTDIKTLSYNIHPQYDYIRIQCFSFPCDNGKQELRGYDVSHTVRIKVRDTDMTGDLLSLVSEMGATNVSGIAFSIDDEDVLKADARAKAIADAQEKAKRLAKDLGVRIVRVANFYEERGFGGEEFYVEARAYNSGGDGMHSVPAPQIPQGENTIRSNVNITYQVR